MLDCKEFYEVLERNEISFFTGVPDSLLKHFCKYLEVSLDRQAHVITANEGNAIALATGFHLADGKVPLIYLQNSGLGNIVNPVLSLAHREVYGIPMIIMIGWRGEPGKHDEAQHIAQGRQMIPLLNALELKHEILSDDLATASEQVRTLKQISESEKSPVVLLVPKGTFDKFEGPDESSAATSSLTLTREKAIATIVSTLKPDDLVVATTGKTGRELYEIRGGLNSSDFLNIGAMGHVSQIALGIALQKPERRVVCLDGDGSVIMHMGGLGLIGELAPSNLVHIVLNNRSHDSVGGQPTYGGQVSFTALAKQLNYAVTESAASQDELELKMKALLNAAGPSLLEVAIEKGARSDLGRPSASPMERKEAFMNSLNDS